MASIEIRLRSSAHRLLRPMRGGCTDGSTPARELEAFIARLPAEPPRIEEIKSLVARPCDACARLILPGATEYEITFSSVVFALDRTCFAAWRAHTPARAPAAREPILVIEDEPDLATTYQRLFRRMNHDVVTATRGAEALRFAAANPVALVIVDLRLPDMDGIELVRVLRARPDPPVVIVVSGFTAQTAQDAALAAGAAGYVTKPFTVAALLALIHEALGAR
jgi:CheY-like chemotaxis protein